MEVELAYDPFPIHVPFHATSAREKAAIGAVGSGKTVALCADAILLALTQPGSRIMVCRQSVPSLKETTELEFVALLSKVPEGREGTGIKTLYDLCTTTRTGGHIDKLTFPNGSEVIFRSLDDWRKLMSLNLCGIYIDEASEVDRETYLGLLTRLRQREPTAAAQRQGAGLIRRQQIALATNPNGHDWVWEYFVQGQTEGRRYFRSTTFDNPTLYDDDGEPGAFIKNLLTMPEEWIKRMVLCEFNDFEGQILDFAPEAHVVTHFQPPKDWERAMGLDWGLRNPTACVWWARNPKSGVWYQYREWMSHNPMDPTERQAAKVMNVHEVAAAIKRLEEGETIRFRAADPAIKQRMGESAKSVLYWLGTHGLHFQMGARDYGTRINCLNQLLTNRQLLLSDECPLTAIQFQQYRWSKLSTRRDTNAPERPHKKDDHLVDASQYLATVFMGFGQHVEKKPVPEFREQLREAVHRQAGRNIGKAPVSPMGPE